MTPAQNSSSGIWQLLTNPTVQSVLSVLILLTVCSIAIYVVSKLRDSNTQDVPMDELLRKNFEEMRSGGDIDEAEFRNIASLLAEQPRRSSKPASKTLNTSDPPPSDEK